MKIEIICTGDELVTGLTADTNSPYFMDKLFAVGEKVVRAVVVGDVREDIISAMLEASARADAVLVSGGLGPTADDFTAECAAKAAGVSLIENAEVLETLKARLAQRKIAFTANNGRQAMIPAGAETVRNPVGTAPMFILKIKECPFYFVPGVPREYRALVDLEVIPRMKVLIDQQSKRVFRAFRLLKTVGLPESHLDARVAPIAKLHPKVVFGFRTHAPENHLKLMAEAASQLEADQALAEAQADCERNLKKFHFGSDNAVFTETLAALLKSRKETIAVAESCTGGWVAQLLTSPAGASDYFLGSAVAYQVEAKVRWAKVNPQTLETFGSVSAETAAALATGIRKECGSTYGLSVTGYAGPAGLSEPSGLAIGNEQNPVGTVYGGLATAEGVETERWFFPGGRDRVRQFAAYQALEMLRRHLLGLAHSE